MCFRGRSLGCSSSCASRRRARSSGRPSWRLEQQEVSLTLRFRGPHFVPQVPPLFFFFFYCYARYGRVGTNKHVSQLHPEREREGTGYTSVKNPRWRREKTKQTTRAVTV
ncbi:unnamed protein product [Ixodes pacificus]